MAQGGGGGQGAGLVSDKDFRNNVLSGRLTFLHSYILEGEMMF